MTTLKLGRLPNDPSKPRLKLASLLTTEAPTYPENRDYLSKVGKFPMYLNNKIGDCTFATIGHIIQEVTTYGQGRTITITDDDVLTGYRAVSGYDPATGANDNGAVEQEVLNYWRKTGVAGHKILAFAEVDFRNKEELYAALNIFGTIYLGIYFPDSGFGQLDARQPWDVVENAKVIGGHAINAGYYDVSDGMWKVVTWGQVQPMTQAFWDKYVEEAWVVITPEWFNEKGQSPTGINMYALGEEFAALTGEPNPFPVPAPTPEPVAPPAPSPAPRPPVVDNADTVFAEVLNRWLAKHPFFFKDVQAAARTWLDSKK